MNTVTKSAGMLIEDAGEGRVVAVVATLNTVDNDADVILGTAVPGPAKVVLSAYGHDAVHAGAAPVGKGVVAPEGDRLMFRGRVFLSTPRGRDTFETLKAMGADQEWSFAFEVLKAERPDPVWRAKGAERILAALRPFEVSPVVLAGGVGTRTVDLKRRQDEDVQAEVQAVAANLARNVAAVDAAWRRVARPLPERFGPFVALCKEQFVVFSDGAPTVEFLPPTAFPAGVVGLYTGRTNVIRVAWGRKDHEIARTLAHEFAHVYEWRRGWLPSEPFARAMAGKVMRLWDAGVRAAA